MLKRIVVCLVLILSVSYGGWQLYRYDDGSIRLDPQTVRISIKDTLDVLDEYYVYPDVAKAMRSSVEDRMSSGEYDKIRTDKALIQKLQQDLRQVSDDRHISLHQVDPEATELTHVLPPANKDQQVNSGFGFVEIIEGNIGYLRIYKFQAGEQARQVASDAMSKLAGVDALIIDLTESIGGDPKLVEYICGYLLAENTHLWSILDRTGEAISEGWTPNEKPAGGPAFDLSVYILISKKTFSAAEALAYTLKHNDRAILVGEATGGGAHLVSMERVNEYFNLRTPVSRAYSPITKTNWEGVGVIPDIEVSPGQAKITAIKEITGHG